jgi:hypothetical protein
MQGRYCCHQKGQQWHSELTADDALCRLEDFARDFLGACVDSPLEIVDDGEQGSLRALAKGRCVLVKLLGGYSQSFDSGDDLGRASVISFVVLAQAAGVLGGD